MAGIEGNNRPRQHEIAFNIGSSRGAGQERKPGAPGEGNRWYDQDLPPHEQLVGTIRRLLVQDREQTIAENRKRKEGDKLFLHPFWRLHFHLLDAELNSPGEMRGDIGYLSPQGEFFRSLTNAWDAISYDHYPEGSEEKEDIEGGFYMYLSQEGYREDDLSIVLKDERQVALLDAMAEAVGVPHQRGQRIISLPSSIG